MSQKLGTFFIELVVLILMLCGCSQRHISFDEVMHSVLNQPLDGVREGTSKDLRRFIGLNPNEIESFVYYIPTSSMDVEELLIIQVKDSAQFEVIEELLEQRVASQIDRFSAYKPENCGILDNYEIRTKGRYLFFAVSQQGEELSDQFRAAFRK